MGCFWSCLGLDPINTEVRRPYGDNGQSASVNTQNYTLDWYERKQQYLRSQLLEDNLHLEVSRQPSSNLENRLSARSTGTSSTRSQPAVKVVPRIEPSDTKQRQSRNTRRAVCQEAEPEAKFGKYKCICGRFWSSRLCWPDRYQKCKKCKRPVYPHTYRELMPSDHAPGETDLPEHNEELCQMCEQLGYSCLVFKRNEKLKTRAWRGPSDD